MIILTKDIVGEEILTYENTSNTIIPLSQLDEDMSSLWNCKVLYNLTAKRR